MPTFPATAMRPVGMAGTGYVVVELTPLGQILLTPQTVTLAEAWALTRGDARYHRRIVWVGDLGMPQEGA
jgi:hypothetical protein